MKPLRFNRAPNARATPPPRDRARELLLIREAVARGRVRECPKQETPDPGLTVRVPDFDNLIAPGPTGENGAPKYGGGRWCGSRRREE